jgi:hypothetical protein
MEKNLNSDGLQFYQFINRTGLGFSYQQDRVEIPITGLTLPHIVSVPVPGFPTSCIAVNLCSVSLVKMKGESLFC